MSSTTAPPPTPTITTYANRASYLDATAILATPPPGVTPNFNAPNPNAVLLIIVNVIGVFLCTTITAMRIWTKGHLMRTMGWDDYTCIVSYIGVFLWTIGQIKVSLLGWGGIYYNFRSTWGAVMLKNKYQFFAQDAYLFSIGCVKVSILLMYLRAFTTLKKWFKYTIWVLIFLISGAHIVGFLGWTFSTIPPTCHWTYYPNETDEQYAARCRHPSLDLVLIPYTLFLNVFTVAVDLVILSLPVRPVWQLNLAKRQKISVLVIFFAGGIVTIASLLRLGYFVARFYNHSTVDASVTEFRVNLITTIELDLAQICCCLPILKPFIRQYAPSLLRLTAFTSRSKGDSSARPAASSQHPIKTGRKWRGGSRDEELIGSNYLELGEDGKSDQSYGMSTMAAKEGK